MCNGRRSSVVAVRTSSYEYHEHERQETAAVLIYFIIFSVTIHFSVANNISNCKQHALSHRIHGFHNCVAGRRAASEFIMHT